MARPQKNNADYFSHDNDMRNDDKVKAVRRKFKHEGYSIWNMMLEKLSKSDGFTLKYNEKTLELWAGDFEIETEKLVEILEYFLKVELLVHLEGEIFSENMIRRFTGLIDKRNKHREKFQQQKPAETVIMDAEMPQSKVNKSIVKESKLNNSKEEKKEDLSPDGDRPLPPGIKNAKLFPQMITVYDDFIKKQTGGPGSKINGAEGQAMRQIIEYWRKASKDPSDKGILNSWNHMLMCWGDLEPFYQGKLKLTEINSNMVNLINQIKNPKKAKKSGVVESSQTSQKLGGNFFAKR